MATRPKLLDSTAAAVKLVSLEEASREGITSASIENFVSNYEVLSVELAQKLLDPRYRLGCQISLIVSDAAILGALSLSLGGALLYILPPKLFRYKVSPVLEEYFREHSVFCLLGTKAGAKCIESLIYKEHKVRPSECRPMLLYIYRHYTSRTLLKDKVQLSMKECTSEDVQYLYPLKEGFLKEEVMPHDMDYSASLCLKHLEYEIKTKGLLACQLGGVGGKLVSSLLLKARGKKLVLISSVYTLPQWRSRGFASYMVQEVAHRNLKKGYATVLYVRCDNIQAIKSYTRAGFILACDWIMDYYKH